MKRPRSTVPDVTAGPPPGEAPSLDRRRFLVLGAGAFVLLALPRAVRRSRRLVRRTVPLMGTIAEIAVAGVDEREAEAAIDDALDELRRVERLMSRFRPDSDVGRANRAAVGAAVPVSAASAEVLAAALGWASATEGRFDPGLERAVALWDVADRRVPPPADRVRRFAGRHLYRTLELERRGSGAAVRLHSPEAGVDLGGIAKGYGVDRAVDALRRHGVRDAIVNVGGDLYAMGRSEDGDAWEIGILSPADPRRLATTVTATDRAIATSGDYMRYFDYRGRRYHHLLDPQTGAPRRSRLHSVTMAASTCLAADAAATACFGLEPEPARRLVPRASAELLLTL